MNPSSILDLLLCCSLYIIREYEWYAGHLQDNSYVEFDAEKELHTTLSISTLQNDKKGCLLSSTVEIWNISLSLSNIFKYSHFHE